MDAPQNSGQKQNGQEKKAQLSWSQPISSMKPVASASVASSATQAKSHAMRNLFIAVIAILVIGGVAWAVSGHKKSAVVATTDDVVRANSSAGTPKDSGAVNSGTSANTQAVFPSGPLVITSPQNSGLEVSVSNVVVQVPTWVVIYENYNGQPGNVLGAALFTSDRTSGVADLLRGTLPGQTYFAGEARDDGDHMFSMVNDPAVRDASGNPIVLKFETK